MDPIVYKDVLVLITQSLPVYDISTFRSVCKLFRSVIDTKLVSVCSLEFNVTGWKFTARGVCINGVPYGLWVDVEGGYEAFIDELETRVYAERDIHQHYPENKTYTKEVEKVAFIAENGVKMVTKYIQTPHIHRTETKEILDGQPVVIYDMTEHEACITVYAFQSATSSSRDFVLYKWYLELYLVLHIDPQNNLRIYITKYGLVYDMASNEFNTFPGCKITDQSLLSQVNTGVDPDTLCDTIMSILV